MLQDVAGVVEHEAIDLVRMHAKAAANLLIHQARRLRRAQHRNAVDVRRVEAFRQHVDVDHRAQGARLEIGQEARALGLGGGAVHESRGDASRGERVAHVFGVGHVDAEHDPRAAIGGTLAQVVDRALDQPVRLHSSSQLVVAVFATTDMHPRQVRALARPADQRTQVASLDQVGDPRFIRDFRQYVAGAAHRHGLALEPVRRGG